MELLERWLENYVRSVSKLVNEVGTLEALVNVFFSQSAVPLNISEAVIDHDYTLLAMKRYGEGAKEYWTTTIAALKKMEANIVEPIRNFLQNESRSFRVCLWLPLCFISLPLENAPYILCLTTESQFRILVAISSKPKSTSTTFNHASQPRLGRRKPHL